MENEFQIFDNKETHIYVIDSPMGTGKTTKFIKFINELPDYQRVIFITPYLSECERVINNCKDKNFIQPDVRGGKGRKIDHLLDLIRQEKNIASTHALFANITDEIIYALQSSNYILILDEAFSVVDKFDLFPEYQSNVNKDLLTKSDIKTLLDKGFIQVQEDYLVSWCDEEYLLKKYEPLKRLADRNLLYLVNNTLLLWSFPVEVFREGIFDQIFILTFQFESQIQNYYYSFFGLKYLKYWINPNDNYSVNKTISGNPHEIEWVKEIKPLIKICDNKNLNKIGSYFYDVQNNIIKTSLSKNWYMQNKTLHRKLTGNAINFIRHYSSKTVADDIMWTTFGDFQSSISSKHLSSKHFVSLNARATNEYGHKFVLIYLVNRYLNPFYDHFFLARNVRVDEDKYALNEMIQWIWRSRIRNMKPIEIYLPSQRMRILLEDYLNGEMFDENIDE